MIGGILCFLFVTICVRWELSAFQIVGGTWKFANLEIFIFLVNFSLEITVYALKSILSDSNIQHLLSFG